MGGGPGVSGPDRTKSRHWGFGGGRLPCGGHWGEKDTQGKRTLNGRASRIRSRSEKTKTLERTWDVGGGRLGQGRYDEDRRGRPQGNQYERSTRGLKTGVPRLRSDLESLRGVSKDDEGEFRTRGGH